MPRARKILMGAIALAVVIVVGLVLAGPAMQRSFFYPKPRGLPPVVSQSTEQLLDRLQAVLEAKAPLVSVALQPGLSDAQISALESQGGFHLADDVRALYRWHNGMVPNSAVGLLAGQRFMPLDEVVRERELAGQQAASESGVQRAAFAVFAGHRAGWVQILSEGAGDGYFHDPERADAEGAFFYHFAEFGDYVWFPSVRNFLAGVIECHESQAVRIAADGKSLDEDIGRTEEIWQRFGESSE